MKQLIAIIVAAFAVAVFAAEPGKATETKPAVVKEEAKKAPTKSPSKKDHKKATPAATPAVTK